jgi:hypothetical protein
MLEAPAPPCTITPVRTRTPLRIFYWSSLAIVLAVISLWRLVTLPIAFKSFPEAPVSHVNYGFAEQWRFLLEARHAVLPGSTYTVRAQDLDDEMSLYMFSLALCTRRHGLPTTYFKKPFDEGKSARFVIAYRNFTGGEPNLRFVVGFAAGAVYERVK